MEVTKLRQELAEWVFQYDTMVAVKNHLVNESDKTSLGRQFYKEHRNGINSILVDISEAIEETKMEMQELGLSVSYDGGNTWS